MFVVFFTATLGQLEIALRNLGKEFIEIVWGEVLDPNLATYKIELDPRK